jgi:ATP-dependent DNA ligase
MRAPPVISSDLCQLARDWEGDFPAGGMMLEEKLDGIRAMRFPGVDGQVRIWSRSGIQIEGAGHILDRLQLMEEIAGMRIFVDGEFMVAGTLAATKAWFERGWRSGTEAGVFHAFDVLPFDDWRRGGTDMPLYERKAWLQRLAAKAEREAAGAWDWRQGSHGRDHDVPAVVVVPDQWAAEPADAIDMAQRVWSQGGEGCMAKVADAGYRRGRNGSWLKLKPAGPWAAPRESVRAVAFTSPRQCAAPTG